MCIRDSLAGCRVACNSLCGELEAFFEHCFRELPAFVGVYGIGCHFDKFNPFAGDAEHVIRHRQVYASRHALQQGIKFYPGSINIRWCGAKIEIGGLYFARSDGNAFDTVRKPLVRHELTEVEERKNAVHLFLRVRIAGLVVAYYAFAFFLTDGDKIINKGTVDGEGRFRGFRCKERVTPRQLPDKE